ncbi:MAG TPA: tetratricopeptide repeat protein, partial [Chthoniobacterales bacterium]
MKIDNFFSELKRRNVYKVAVAYAVVGWLLVQVATQVFPFFEIPNWAVRLIVLMIVIGFPIALVIAWAFELTPEGLKRTEDVDLAEQSRKKSRAWIFVVIIGTAFSVGLFFIGRYTGRNTASAARTEAATGPSISQKSIAVLPFENLSSDKENAYFAEGIQDEILTRLSKIAALKVISRTSTRKYKSAPDNLREVGNQLGVANLLEGSVQKIANAVHINVQLVRAASDEHLWAESYNRKLDDVFAVEGEVAKAIADQLEAKLTGAEQRAVTAKPTQNAAAYDAYLRGQSLEHSEYSYDAGRQAARDYAEAVQLDPKFAIAWARLAVVRSWLYFNGIDPDVNTADAVKESADRAMAIAPEAGESWLATGTYRYRVSRKFESALAAFEEARKRSPNDSSIYRYLGVVQRRLGRWPEAEASYKKALELDPRDITLLNDMGSTFYAYLRRFDDAHALTDQAL